MRKNLFPTLFQPYFFQQNRISIFRTQITQITANLYQLQMIDTGVLTKMIFAQICVICVRKKYLLATQLVLLEKIRSGLLQVIYFFTTNRLF